MILNDSSILQPDAEINTNFIPTLYCFTIASIAVLDDNLRNLLLSSLRFPFARGPWYLDHLRGAL